MLWRSLLAALVAVRVAVPLAALAASGSQIPGLPRYEYGPLTGDGPAYYSTARELIAGWRAVGAAGLLVIAAALVAGAAAASWLWRNRPASRPWVIVGMALLLALGATAGISESHRTAAGAVGWPLLWSVPLVPLRVAGVLDPDSAFGVGLALSLLANAATVVATAYGGLYATGRRWVGLLAAALFALWPFLAGLVAGSKGWENGTWQVDAGLHMYTEPLSTALVATGAALLLRPVLTPVRLALAGVALGYAVAVRPTNGFLAVLALVLLFGRVGWRRAAPYVAAALTVIPILVAFSPKRYGYELDVAAGASRSLYSPDYFASSWVDSLLWSPRALAVLLPLAVLGAWAVRSRFALALVAGWALLNPLFYSFFRATADHPRYLFASLPAALVLWAGGAAALALGVRKVSERRTIMSS